MGVIPNPSLLKVIPQRAQRTGRMQDPRECGRKDFEHHMMGGRLDFPLRTILAGQDPLNEEKEAVVQKDQLKLGLILFPLTVYNKPFYLLETDCRSCALYL